MATTERAAKNGRMCEVYARWLTLAGALFISGCTSDGPAPPPAGSGSCLAAYDDGFDPAALLGSWAQPPCEGESEATCLYESLDVGDIERCYQVTVPSASASSPLPIVLMWHGSDSNGASFRSNMNDDFADLHFEQTVADGALVVYPSGLAHADCNGTSCWDRDPTGRDIAFFDALAPLRNQTFHTLGELRRARFLNALRTQDTSKARNSARVMAG